MMKTFSQFISEALEIREGGLNRIAQHSKSRNTAVLTANRGDKSSKENKSASPKVPVNYFITAMAAMTMMMAVVVVVAAILGDPKDEKMAICVQNCSKLPFFQL